MRADHDVDLAALDLLAQISFCCFGGAEAAEIISMRDRETPRSAA